MGKSRFGSGLPVEHAFSAGGVVIRHGHDGPELVLGLRRHDGRRPIGSLPTGTPVGEETPAQTALGVVTEETGL